MKKHIAGAYRKNDESKDKPTQDQVQQLLEMGISLEKKIFFDGNDFGKAGFGIPIEICEAAKKDLTIKKENLNKGGKADV